jgi:hypothetical protein
VARVEAWAAKAAALRTKAWNQGALCSHMCTEVAHPTGAILQPGHVQRRSLQDCNINNLVRYPVLSCSTAFRLNREQRWGAYWGATSHPNFWGTSYAAPDQSTERPRCGQHQGPRPAQALADGGRTLT